MQNKIIFQSFISDFQAVTACGIRVDASVTASNGHVNLNSRYLCSDNDPVANEAFLKFTKGYL